MSDLRDRARAVLAANDRGGYCVPTHGLYPFQWLWDSAFTALGWATWNEARAWQELETTTRGQWADGMLPHITFHQSDEGYFPGPDVWGTSGVAKLEAAAPPTSGITQPPVHAFAMRWMLERSADATLANANARALFPRVLAFHRWLHTHRDPRGSGLVAIVHPWEAGTDNSPEWDEALARVPVPADLPPYTRRDTSHVDADQRPSAFQYDRYLSLVHRFKGVGYDPARVLEGNPFRAAGVIFNAILHRADRDLRWLAERLGEPTAEMDAWISRGQAGLETLWDETAGAYRSRDLVTGEFIGVTTSSSFVPLFAGACSERQAERLARTLEAWGERVRYLVPSTDPAHAHFDARRYWRGPVWGIVNWMIALGLDGYGYGDLAKRLRSDTLELTRRSGFAEYWEPNTGEALGGGQFTWTAAIALLLEADTP